MYRLVLRLPLRVILLHRDIFETEAAAKEATKMFPQGFTVITDDEAKEHTHAIPVPFRIKPLQREPLAAESKAK
jgi:hypothetical protein